ncbi:MAG: hypothetical protein BRD44_05890 [Bacteroidetes bacterium QS_7_67_15]|nr:MAG: hypothetical protein BRD44_05890 [Bacteroidetes bacterium QS_7_67_15]
MAYAFYLGIDITDEATGPTATLSLVEKEQDDPQPEVRYHVRTIERTDDLEGEDPGGDDGDEHHAFAGLATRVQDLLVSEPQEVGHSVPVVNATGEMGRAALHAIEARGLTPVGITLTGGESAAQSGSGVDLEGGDSAADDEAGFFVSEADLCGRLVRLETQGRLTIEHESTRYASDLAHGLQSWRTRVDTAEQTEEAEALGEAIATGDDPSADEADPAEQVPGEPSARAQREEAHDVFVTSAALACWLGEERSFDPTEHLGGAAPTTGEAKRINRPDTAS